MPFKRTPQTFNASIKTVMVGTGDHAVELGGANTFPFYTFDSQSNWVPKIGIEVSDLGVENWPSGIKDHYNGADSVTEIARKAAQTKGADFICLRFEGADPNGLNRPVEECAQIACDVADAVEVPLVIAGCKNIEKDAALFEKAAQALHGRNVLFLSAREENYKAVGAAVGLAYGHKSGAESSVDINLAKQLNILLHQLGVNPESIVMDLGSAAAGYGFEYLISTMDRVRAAALSQNDAMLQMPIITPVSFETWNVKESVLPEEDMPQWGSAEERGVHMEVVTAVACLASGSDAVILRHPRSIETVSSLIKALL
jgi:acetyl-CoA decarbonylase/synthase complex subunit delta